jgi:hypothetical protein
LKLEGSKSASFMMPTNKMKHTMESKKKHDVEAKKNDTMEQNECILKKYYDLYNEAN